MKLNNKLAEMARKAGICEEWFIRLMYTEDKDKLIKMYLEGIDFCLSNEYPDNELYAGTLWEPAKPTAYSLTNLLRC